MGATTGSGEIVLPALNLVDKLKELGFQGTDEAAAAMLANINLQPEITVDDLNGWVQGNLALAATGLLEQEESGKIEVTPDLTKAALGLALLSGETTPAIIERLRRVFDV